MLLHGHGDITRLLIKLKERDDRILHKLCADGPTNEIRKLVPTQPYVLPNLHETELVLFALRLHGQNIMSPSSVDTHVDLVRFHLADVRNSRSEMALK